MKNIKFYILFVSVSFLASCSQGKREYYPTGQLWLIYEKNPDNPRQKVTEYDTLGNIISITFDNLDHQLDSIGHYYYADGNLKATINFKNGQKNGEAKWYYPNGQLKEYTCFINDQTIGEHEFYDIDGSLSKVYFFKIRNGMSEINGELIYKNEIIEKNESRYAEIVTKCDTINSGNFAEYKIGWICGNGAYVRALTGNIDHNFNVVDSSSLKPVNLDGAVSKVEAALFYGQIFLSILFIYMAYF